MYIHVYPHYSPWKQPQLKELGSIYPYGNNIYTTAFH